MKKTVLAVGFIVALIPFGNIEAAFNDVFTDSSYFEAIDYVQKQSIVSGYEDGSFQPDKTINRAEFTKIIIEAVYPGLVGNTGCFSDVQDEWFANYVCIAKEQNVIDGYPDGTFRPSQRISFVEAAKIITEAFGFDVVESELWYQSYIEKLEDLNAIPISLVTLEQRITRGQMAEMIFRIRETINDKPSKRFSDFVSTGVAKSNTQNEIIDNKEDGNDDIEVTGDNPIEKVDDDIPFVSMYRNSLSNAGVYKTSPVRDLRGVKWKFDAVSPIYAAPGYIGNYIFFGTENGRMVGVNRHTGELFWKTTTLHRNYIFATPIITELFVIWGGYDAYFYNISSAAGQKVWKSLVGSSVYGSPLLFEDKVIFGSEDGFVRALDVTSGAEKWRMSTRGEVISSPAMHKRFAYVGSIDQHVYAVGVDKGEQAWKFRTNGEIEASPAVGNEKVYIGNKEGRMHALDAVTGDQVWSFDSGDEIISTPAVTSNAVYFGSKDGYVYALDSETGVEIWKFKTEDEVISSPSIAGDVLYIGSNDANLYALDVNTGVELWRFQTEGKISASPVVIDGVVYIGSYDGYMYALE